MLAENRQINDYLFANQESKFVLVHKKYSTHSEVLDGPLKHLTN